MRDAEPAVRLLEAFEKVLPREVVVGLAASTVLPRINATVKEWEPRVERVAIHVWLHPWLPLLQTALEEVYPEIRRKLAAALTAWNPSDPSALVMLRPWKAVFGVGEWDSFMARSIVPKLEADLAQLSLNPAALYTQPLDSLLAWQGVLSSKSLLQLMNTYFFPQWHEVLRHWLEHDPTAHDDVIQWYLSWKAYFPRQLQDEEIVRLHLSAALNYINQTAAGAAPSPHAGVLGGVQSEFEQPGVGPGVQTTDAARQGRPVAGTQPPSLGLRQFLEAYAA